MGEVVDVHPFERLKEEASADAGAFSPDPGGASRVCATAGTAFGLTPLGDRFWVCDLKYNERP